METSFKGAIMCFLLCYVIRWWFVNFQSQNISFWLLCCNSPADFAPVETIWCAQVLIDGDCHVFIFHFCWAFFHLGYKTREWIFEEQLRRFKLDCVCSQSSTCSSRKLLTWHFEHSGQIIRLITYVLISRNAPQVT